MKGAQVRGKFESNLRHSGMVLISKEMSRVIKNLKRRNREEFLQLRTKLEDELGHIALNDLMKAFPTLESVLLVDDDEEGKLLDGTASVATPIAGGTLNVSREAQNAFNRACAGFVRVICNFVNPLIIFFDDLQWSDTCSIEALDNLIFDNENNNLMIIGVYRSNEVDETHGLAKLKRELLASNEKDLPCEVTEIPLGHLEVEAVNKVLQALLNTDKGSKTLPLAELCHKKSLGNPFHLVNFLRSLEENSLLEFHFGLMEWRWNSERIISLTQASDNVVDLLLSQMTRQPALVRRTLALAAFLGFTFSESSLLVVWQSCVLSGEHEDTETLKDALGRCEDIGFIELSGPSSFSFVHDAIQEAALAMTPPEDRPRLRSLIGDRLSQELSDAELEEAIFTVVNLLNSDPTIGEGDPERRIEVSKLNLRAAQRAVTLALFERAFGFVEHAIRCLPASKWQSDYDLTLELFSLRAELAIPNGNSEQMEEYCDEVFSLKDKPIVDKLRAYKALIDAKSNLNLERDALKLCLETLKKCGCRIFKGPFARLCSVPANFFLVKTTIRSRIKDRIDEMPIVEDELVIAQLELLDKLVTCCYIEQNDIFPIAIFRLLKLTLKCGLSEFAPLSLTLVGVVLGIGGDFEASAFYAEYAMNLLDRIPNSKRLESRTLYIAHTFCLHWTKPLSCALKPLFRAYESGLKSGDTESATYAIWNYVNFTFFMGKPIELIERDCRVYLAQLKHLKRENAAFLVRCLWQVVLNLLGQSANPVILVGEAMDEEECKGDVNVFRSSILLSNRCVVRLFFADYAFCAREAIAHGDEMQTTSKGHFISIAGAFHMALPLLVMAQSTGSRIYRREGKKYAARIKRLAKAGNPNVKHYEAILDAELAVLNGKKETAKKCYERSVVLSARAGFLQDAAIASERFSLFLKRGSQDEEEAAFRMEESIKYYRAWGAHKKADILEKAKQGFA